MHFYVLILYVTGISVIDVSWLTNNSSEYMCAFSFGHMLPMGYTVILITNPCKE